MFKSVIQSMLKKALYGAAGSLAAFLGTIQTFHSATPGEQNALVWTYCIVPAVTALAGGLSRWANFDPARVGK